jgi:hypothetical protein
MDTLPSPIERLVLRLRRHSLTPPSTPDVPVSAIQELLGGNPALAEACGHLDLQGLFIIGAARTGTTILQNALNDSDHVFLLGEPALHHDAGDADFAVRYNAMHRAWHNQENKSSHCPGFFEGDASWYAYLLHLAGLYRRVGAKLVINPEDAEAEASRVFDFYSRYFYRSHYVFTFRNPLDMLMSVRGLASWNGADEASHVAILRCFYLVLQLYLRMLRNLPHVSAVFHESVDANTFEALGNWLSVDLKGAAAYYDSDKVRHHALAELPEAWRGVIQQAVTVYEDLRGEVQAGGALLQLEQNSRHIDERHYTVLGKLWRRTELLLESLE